MKVVIDNNIPYIKGRLEPLADVVYLAGSEIHRKDLIDADALIVRTRTKVDRKLLENTSIKFVGTATIGTDHIDTDWCQKNGIYCTSAPGCNSGSVMQYIASALAELQSNYKLRSDQTTLGIIGAGNIGKKVAKLAEALGFKILLNDPPRERKEGSAEFTSIDNLLWESDIISVHVPLTMTGKDKTFKLIGSTAFENVKNDVIIINTSRGGVVDEEELLRNLKSGKVKSCILDVWENEPIINRELLGRTLLATPHIAGYSVDGKLNGAMTIVTEFSHFFKLQLNPDFSDNGSFPGDMDINIDDFHGSKMDKVSKVILYTYPILSDHAEFSSSPENFEELRNNYWVRREFQNYTVKGSPSPALDILASLGFKIKIHRH